MADPSAAPPPAPGAAFMFRDREYVLPRVEQADKKAFTVWCGARAMAAIRDQEPLIEAGVLTRDQWVTDYRSAQLRVMAGEFWWDEPGGESFRMTDAGHAQLCWLCLRRADPEITLGTVEAMMKAGDGLLLWRQYKIANADPTAPRSAVAGGGGTSTPGSSGTAA